MSALTARPLRLGLVKGVGVPRVDRSRLPRGLVANPILNVNWCPDPVSGLACLVHNATDFPLRPTAYGLGYPLWFAKSKWIIPRSAGTGAYFSRAVLFKTGATVGDTGIINDRGLFSGDNDKYIEVYLSKASCWVYNGSVVRLNGTTTLQPNTLYMFAMTVANGTMKLYLNGVEEATTGSASGSQTYAASLEIGSAVNGQGAVVYAAYAAHQVAWTPGEVMALWQAPYGHLEWDENRIWGLWGASAGGTTYNDTISDAVTAADSLIAAVSFSAELAGSWTLAESLAAAAVFEAPLTDATSTSDSLICVATFEAASEDSITAAEAFAAALSIETAFSDALTAADSLAYALVFGVALTDSIAAAESFGVVATFAASMTDSAVAAESFVGGLVYTSAISDGWAVGDSLDDSLTLFAQAAFTMLQVTVMVGRIELVSGGPDATFINLTEQQSRV